MANLILQLEEQQPDLRSREKTYRFTAENRGSKPVSLRPLIPQIPDGVELLDVKDAAERVVLLKRSMLSDDLTNILKSYILRLEKISNPGFFDRSRFKNEQTTQEPAKQVIRNRSGSETTDIDFKIESIADAQMALATWVQRLKLRKRSLQRQNVSAQTI